MELIVVFVLWWMISHVISELIPLLIQAIWHLFVMLGLCIIELVRLIARLLGGLLFHTFRLLVIALRLTGTFLFILFDEWRRGDDEETAAPDQPVSAQEEYAAALALLGLREPFTHQALKQVYRQAMKAAHTDIGGDKEDAQALNAARDLVMTHKGWR